MKLNSKLPSIRIDKELYDLLNKTLLILNKNDSGVTFRQSDIIRMALKDFCSKTLTEGLTLDFKIVLQKETKH